MVANDAVSSAMGLASTWVNPHTGALAARPGRYAVGAREYLREVLPVSERHRRRGISAALTAVTPLGPVTAAQAAARA